MNFEFTLLTIYSSGDYESPKVTTLLSSNASGTNDALDGKDAIGLYSVGGHISGIPEDMLAAIDCRQTPAESQKTLHAVLKPQMSKLCQILHLSVSGFFACATHFSFFAYVDGNWNCHLIPCYGQMDFFIVQLYCFRHIWLRCLCSVKNGGTSAQNSR